MKFLLDALSAFQMEQIEKFVLRIPKHNDGTNVCDDKNWTHYINDELLPPKPNLDIFVLENHLVEEFSEYFGLDAVETIKLHDMIYRHNYQIKPVIHESNECVDIANLAFLIWTVKQ